MKYDLIIKAMKIIGSIAVGVVFSIVVHKLILLNREVNAYGFQLVVLYVVFLLIPALCVTIGFSVAIVALKSAGRVLLVWLWVPALIVVVFDVTEPYFKDRQRQQF